MIAPGKVVEKSPHSIEVGMDVDVKFMGSQVNLSTLPGVQRVSYKALLRTTYGYFKPTQTKNTS